jgi:hypothetical protein
VEGLSPCPLGGALFKTQSLYLLEPSYLTIDVDQVGSSTTSAQVSGSQVKHEFSSPSTQAKVVETEIQVPLFSDNVVQSPKNAPLTTSQRPVQYVKGDRVFNQKFGLGTVVGVKQFGGQVREVVIDFDLLPDIKTLVVTAVQLA